MNAATLCVAAALLAPAAAIAAEHIVTIEGMAFRPATLTVKSGDRVTWRNLDLVPHTASAAGGFDSGAIAPGQAWTWTAHAKGRHAYVCTYHLGMKATVVVE
jgi:plastocyanin